MRRDEDYIFDILGAAARISSYIAPLTRRNLDDDPLVQDAIIRQIEIIGEASKQVSEDLRRKYPSVRWRDWTDMRNFLIHAYHQVATEEVWIAATVDVPALMRLLTEPPAEESPPES